MDIDIGACTFLKYLRFKLKELYMQNTDSEIGASSLGRTQIR